MDKNTNNKEIAETGNLHLPMGQLFFLLHVNGFKVKPDDYIELLKVTERFGSSNIDETAKWICPIIATTETEQLRFYNIVEQYKKLQQLQPAHGATVVENKFARWLKIALACLLLSLLFLAAYFYFKKEDYQLEESSKERTVEKGGALLLDAATLLKNPAADSGRIHFNWQFEDGTRQEAVKVLHTFKTAGDYIIKREFSSAKLALNKKSDSLLIHVCSDLPKININIPAAAIIAQEPVNITATVDADSGTVSFYQWTIGDSVFTTMEPLVYNFVFSKEGDVAVECKAVVGRLNSPCTATDNKIIQVQDNGLHYNAGFSAPLTRIDNTTGLKWWVTLILLVPAAAGLLYSIFKRKARKQKPVEAKPVSKELTRGPYDIPFEQNDLKLIQQETELRRTFIQMRYKAEEETLVLNVAATIGSIIQSGGSPQLVFAPLTQQQQYLVLIDRANPKNMLTRFFNYLVKSMAEDGIPVIVFYYDKNFICYNDHFPGGLPLQRLADMHQNATLIIIGKAHELVYNVYAVIEEKFLKELTRWQNKAIITPQPVKDWAVKEKVLQEFIILVPADVMALQKLIPALKEKVKPHERLLEITAPDRYSLRDIDFREAKDLQTYLDNDDAMVQWLCAICIYPRLKWEVLIEIGKSILDKYGQPEKLNYTSLLTLCRISWMQEGVFPQATRLELLKLLKTENEICARETLLRMLNYSTLLYGEKGYFFEEEKKRQQITNQFVLHASDNIRYKQYAASKEAFKTLWQKNVLLDMPVKKYLDKSGDANWQTPVTDGRQSISLAKYFNLKEVALSKTMQLKRVISAAISILLILVWSYISWGDGAAVLAPWVVLNENNGTEMIPVAINVKKNFSSCGDTSGNRFDQLNGYMEINNKQFLLVYDTARAVANFNVPYNMMNSGKAIVMFSWNNNKTVAATLNFKNNLLPDSVTISCMGPQTVRHKQLYVRYNDANGYNDIQSALSDALSGYYISALQVDFTDSSRIVYYQENQKLRADSIVQTIKDKLQLLVKEEYVKEIRTPEAIPILFLNTIRKDTVLYDPNVAMAANDPDEHHRMADQYFVDKQYLKAIEEYSKAMEADKQNGLLYYQRGICYDQLNKLSWSEKALADFTTAIELDNKNTRYYYSRAGVEFDLKKYTAAIADYSRVIASGVDAKSAYKTAYYFRGKSYYNLKNQASACKDFKKAGDLGIAAGKKDYNNYCIIAAADLPNTAPNTAPNVIAPPTETALGNIELDEKGYTDATGQQVIQKASRLLKAQPQGKIKLTAFYDTDADQKALASYMNTIVGMFEKIGVNKKTQIIQQLSKNQGQQQQQQQNYISPENKKLIIRVTGINLKDNARSAS